MARRKATTGPTPVDAFIHSDKRTNIPTADAEAFVDDEVEAVRKVRYERDETLDPQLVWRGKYADDAARDQTGDDLVVDAPAIYIQEKIDPRVLIENLRRTAQRPEEEPEMTLFDDFDGLDELDLVDFYQHDTNWSNRMILGDSLHVMSSLAERERLRGRVQMIYIDPPYGIKFGSNWQASIRNRDVKDGSLVDVPRDAEQIKAFRDTWELGKSSYLSYLRDRLIASRELLCESGSCFVQIGDENVHLVRSLMDEIFGSEQFVSQIVFKKTSGATSQFLPPTTDFIIWYARNSARLKYHPPLRPRDSLAEADSAYAHCENSEGVRRRLSSQEIEGIEPLAPDERAYRYQILTSPRVRAARSGYFPVELDGNTFLPTTGEWKTHEKGMQKLRLAGRLAATGKTLSYIRYLNDFRATAVSNLWEDTQSGSGMDKTYVVQSSAKVVQRCILMATDPGDIVLDPTCGSGTSSYVAEQWGRRWITIDTSRVALALARQRIMAARFPWYILSDSASKRRLGQRTVGDPIASGDHNDDVRQGFVNERVQRITLRSIANNPDIEEGMDRKSIEEAIARHADYEVIYDRPREDSKKVRVAGPFTVESLSPHRSLAFAGNRGASTHESASEGEAAQTVDGAHFEQSILNNLAKAGIQNGRRAERITFAAFETFAGSYIQALGERVDAKENEAQNRVAIAIGPQYGTVSPRFVKDAAREALAAEDVGLLCILAFAFEPQVAGVTEEDGVTVDASDDGFANVTAERKLGRIPVLMVRMNADLLMGEELKKTGAGNLFTIFGEPDLEITETADGLVVQLHGVDVYDPTTGEVRSKDTDQIALWMIDTDYNDDSFFVRHCYFTGGNDPYKRLKTALKADIDADAWASLYSTTSRPFIKPSTGKIAVKVINDYGDEVMKVFEV